MEEDTLKAIEKLIVKICESVKSDDHETITALANLIHARAVIKESSEPILSFLESHK